MLSEIENWQVFTLCKEFYKLSLDESGSSSEECGSSSSSSSSSTSLVKPSSYSYGAIPRFLHSFTHSHWSQSIIKQLRAPFIEISRNYMDSSLFQSYNILMGLGLDFFAMILPIVHIQILIMGMLTRPIRAKALSGVRRLCLYCLFLLVRPTVRFLFSFLYFFMCSKVLGCGTLEPLSFQLAFCGDSLESSGGLIIYKAPSPGGNPRDSREPFQPRPRLPGTFSAGTSSSGPLRPIKLVLVDGGSI